MKNFLGKTVLNFCFVLVSAVLISACGDNDSASAVDSLQESSSSVEYFEPVIESSTDFTSIESSSGAISSNSETTVSSSCIESSSSAIVSIDDFCSTNYRYKYSHDESNNKFTIFEDNSYDECQHLNDNYVFTHIDEVLLHNRSYIFVGDTLVIIQSQEGDPDTMVTVLVGGTANKLLGDWSFTTCDYKAGSILCNNKPESYTIHYVFDADSQFVYFTQADGSCIPAESIMPSDGTLDNDESYTDTYAMRDLYESIINIKKGDTQSISVLPSSFFLQKGGITVPSEVIVSSQNKYAVAFTIGGQEFSATIGENTHRIQYYSDSQSEVDLTLASGDAVCQLHYFRDAKLSSETCKAENAPYFGMYTHEDTGIEYVDSYKVDNIDEFKTCLITLVQ